MKITRISAFTNVEHTMDIDISEAQLAEIETRKPFGRHIQDIAPLTTADEREFIMTGITPEEWRDVFGDEDY